MDKSFIDKLAFIYLKNGKLLFSLSRGNDAWYTPGGKRETGETDEAALRREVKEELSVELKSNTIKLYGVFAAQAHNKPDGIVVRMTCYTAEIIGNLKAANEIEKIAYYSYHDDFKRGPVDYVIMDDLFKKGLMR